MRVVRIVLLYYVDMSVLFLCLGGKEKQKRGTEFYMKCSCVCISDKYITMDIACLCHHAKQCPVHYKKVETECVCRCKKSITAGPRFSILCYCCDIHKCPVHCNCGEYWHRCK